MENIIKENDIIKEINQDLCICRKNKLHGLYEQCSYKKKIGAFCGKHSKGTDKLLVNESLPEELKQYINISNYIKNGKKVLNKANILELLNTIRNYKITTKDYSKPNMIDLLKHHFDMLNKYSGEDNLEKIKKIQNLVKKFIENKEHRLRGPAYINRKLCNNPNDFLSFDELEDIPNKYFFSFRDKDNFIYGFDIRSFNKLIDCKMDNPYNRNKIPKQAITNLKTLINNPKYDLNEIQIENSTIEQKFNQKVLSIFQKIDELDTYAGGTNIDWFLNLSRHQLRLYYKVLEDIWNYRSELSNSRKNQIVPNKKMFPISVHTVYNITEKNRLRKILLNEMEKLVSTSTRREDKILGSYYILIGLVEVSQEVAEALPWLVQV